jgi:hypothetical protein
VPPDQTSRAETPLRAMLSEIGWVAPETAVV